MLENLWKLNARCHRLNVQFGRPQMSDGATASKSIEVMAVQAYDDHTLKPFIAQSVVGEGHSWPETLDRLAAEVLLQMEED